MQRLPSLGEVTRWFREPGANPWARQPVPGEATPAAHALVSLGLAHGDQTIQQLDVRERWQFRPELERVLHGSVTSEWSEGEVQELVDLVLTALRVAAN